MTDGAGTPNSSTPLLLARGGVVGAVAALAVAVLTFLVVSVAVDPPDSAVPVWKGVSWYALEGHFVPIHQRTAGGDASAVDLLGDADPVVALAVRALPPLVGTAAGAALAHRADATDTVTHPAVVGATVAVGYLPVLAAAALATTHVVTVDLVVATLEAAIAPAVGPALLAGAAYPLAFGALGGALLAAVRRRHPQVPGGERGEH
jgi:hypothetical protein